MNDVAFWMNAIDGCKGGAEVCVKGNDEVEFHDDGEEGREDDGECRISIEEA